MKQATGWLTSDNCFFQTQWQAELHEAEMKLLARLVGANVTDPEKVLTLLRFMSEEVRYYVHAYETSLRQEHELLSKEDAAPVLKQQAGGDEPLPTVGSSLKPEEVFLHGKVNGFGSGLGNARDVLGEPDIPTGAGPGADKARDRYRKPPFRNYPMEED